MSKFPAQIDNDVTLPKVIDNLSSVTGDSVNRLRAAIIAIENELGIKPSGVYSTVRGRLDALETAVNNLTEFSLAGDLGGTPDSPLVVGMQGRPISSQTPLLNQVLTWNGTTWIPDTQDTVILNVLPTSILLPSDVTFLSGDGYSASTSPFRIGARIIDLNLYPSSWPDGRIRTMTFKADLEVNNAATDGYAQIKDITHNAVILNSTLHTNSLGSVELEAIILAGTTDGYMREDCCDLTMYEAQIYLTNGNGITDQVICRNARIEFTYTDPILVTALVALALPTDINIVAGVTLNGFTTAAGIGGRKLDMTKFPLTLSDGRIRTVKFIADTEVSAPGVDGYIELFDTTHNVLVTGTQFHFTNTIADEVSAVVAVGSSAGNIRNDVITRYEARIWKVSGSPADRVICSNARIQVTYA
jgi:hypothetical protein